MLNVKRAGRNTLRTLTVLALAVLLLRPEPFRRTQAAAGDLDTKFGSGGRISSSLSTSERILALALQADGMIVAAG